MNGRYYKLLLFCSAIAIAKLSFYGIAEINAQFKSFKVDGREERAQGR